MTDLASEPARREFCAVADGAGDRPGHEGNGAGRVRHRGGDEQRRGEDG